MVGRHTLARDAYAGWSRCAECSLLFVSGRVHVVAPGTDCMAGGGGSVCAGPGGAVAERWNGRRWSREATAAVPGGLTTAFNGVSCASAGACTAVGTYLQSTTYAPLAEGWNGTRWSVEPTPFDAHAGENVLDGVSCSSARACTAVGGLPNPGTTLIQRWDGKTWTVQPSPNPPATVMNDLASVSCISAVKCVAVGASAYPNIASLAEVWDGSRWRIDRTP
jgi:hypothetical protein